LERLANLLRAEARRSGAAYGLQPVQLDALNYLAMCNRYSNTPLAVAEYLGLTKGTVSQTLNVLEARGLISKTADAEDKRQVRLKITTTGVAVLRDGIPAPLLAAACSSISEVEREQVLSGLRTLLLACQRANNFKAFGACHTCRYNQRIAEGDYFCGLTQEPLSTGEVNLICREHAA
jgi:DNA-binding MarR family transcriptional regulator